MNRGFAIRDSGFVTAALPADALQPVQVEL